jgi:hypothetical protein
MTEQAETDVSLPVSASAHISRVLDEGSRDY